MDFSKYGIKEGLAKTFAVAQYIILSMAVVGLGLYVSDTEISWEKAKVAMLVAGANLLLAFLQKWVTTHAPESIDAFDNIIG